MEGIQKKEHKWVPSSSTAHLTSCAQRVQAGFTPPPHLVCNQPLHPFLPFSSFPQSLKAQMKWQEHVRFTDHVLPPPPPPPPTTKISSHPIINPKPKTRNPKPETRNPQPTSVLGSHAAYRSVRWGSGLGGAVGSRSAPSACPGTQPVPHLTPHCRSASCRVPRPGSEYV